MSKKILEFLKKVFKDTVRTAWVIFKIMIPVSIVVKILDLAGVIHYIGDFLAPVMKLAGLPGETGLIWATTMFANIYAGLIVYFNLLVTLKLTVAQITVLSVMMLTAHTLPLELQVARKAGVKMGVMFAIRFGFGLLAGIILNLIYSNGEFLQTIPKTVLNTQKAPDPSLISWALNEIGNYLIIFLIIFSLILLMAILKKLGIIQLMTNLLKPILGWLGIDKEVIPITIIGLTLGLLYGGALIIKESEAHHIKRMDIFYSLTLMGLCHSLIEDSLLMISIGGHYSGVFIFRMIFALLITFLIVKITKKLSNKKNKKFLLVKKNNIAV